MSISSDIPSKSKRCWMGDLPDDVKTSPLCSLSIPGSHDSFTYSLEKSGSAGPDQPEMIRYITRKFPKISSQVLYRWSVTQRKSLEEQLESGVRYFDIRLQAVTERLQAVTERLQAVTERLQAVTEDIRLQAVREGPVREFRILHCLLGERVTMLLSQVKNFLLENKSEIVILDFQHLYEFTQHDHENLTKILMTLFQDMMCTWQQSIIEISLSTMLASGARVILIYPAIYQIKNNPWLDPVTQSYLWPRSLCPTPWPNTTNTSYLRRFLRTKLYNRDFCIFLVSQGVLTPNLKTVLFHPFSNLEKVCGNRCNKALRKWLNDIQNRKKKKKYSPTVGRPNIVITDFVAGDQCSSDIIDIVISLNYQAALDNSFMGPTCGNYDRPGSATWLKSHREEVVGQYLIITCVPCGLVSSPHKCSFNK